MRFHWMWIFAPALAGCLGPSLPVKPAPAPAEEAAEEDNPFASSAKAFGIYQWNKDSTYESGLQWEISTLGTSPSYALYFVDVDMGFPADIVRFNSQRNIKTVISQELR